MITVMRHLLAFIFASQLQAKKITLNCEIVGSKGLNSYSLEGSTANSKKKMESIEFLKATMRNGLTNV